MNLISNTIYGNEHKCFVGRSWDDNRWFAGCVSELRVWTVERKADELMKYAYELNTEVSDTNGLLCYWKFNEGTGKIVRDYSENGCNLEAEKVRQYGLQWRCLRKKRNNVMSLIINKTV